MSWIIPPNRRPVRCSVSCCSNTGGIAASKIKHTVCGSKKIKMIAKIKVTLESEICKTNGTVLTASMSPDRVLVLCELSQILAAPIYNQTFPPVSGSSHKPVKPGSHGRFCQPSPCRQSTAVDCRHRISHESACRANWNLSQFG